jgi:hypothetical protein
MHGPPAEVTAEPKGDDLHFRWNANEAHPLWRFSNYLLLAWAVVESSCVLFSSPWVDGVLVEDLG